MSVRFRLERLKVQTNPAAAEGRINGLVVPSAVSGCVFRFAHDSTKPASQGSIRGGEPTKV